MCTCVCIYIYIYIVSGAGITVHTNPCERLSVRVAVARVALRQCLRLRRVCNVTVCDHPTPCASVTICDGKHTKHKSGLGL